jgi:hypothetical protein
LVDESSDAAGLGGTAGAFASVALGDCAKIAAQLKTAAHPSHKSLDRIDIFTVKASRFV